MKILIAIASLTALIFNASVANAKSNTIVSNMYKPIVTSCTLDINSKINDSKILAKKLVIKSDKKLTASVYLLDYSRLNSVNNSYYYRIQYQGKVVSNLIVNVLNTQHPHGGPNGQNIGITACNGKNAIKPIVKIGKESRRLQGYISPDYYTHINYKFNWQNINLRR